MKDVEEFLNWLVKNNVEIKDEKEYKKFILEQYYLYKETTN